MMLGSRKLLPLSTLTERIQHQIFSDALHCKPVIAGLEPCLLHICLDCLPRCLKEFTATLWQLPSVLNCLSPSTFQVIQFCSSRLSHCSRLLPPSLVSLQLQHCESPYSEPFNEMAVPLIGTLRRHSRLSSLRGSSTHNSAAMLELIAPTLPTFAALTSLHLGTCTDNAHIPAGAHLVLAQTLRAMPQLRELGLAFDLHIDCNSLAHQPRLKRPRSYGSAAAPPQPCLSRMLSPATALTALHLSILQCTLLCDSNNDSLAGLQLLHLCDLRMHVMDCKWATLLLERLRAPLTRLELSRGRHPPTSVRATVVSCALTASAANAPCSSACLCCALRTLDLAHAAPTGQPLRHGRIEHGLQMQVCELRPLSVCVWSESQAFPFWCHGAGVHCSLRSCMVPWITLSQLARLWASCRTWSLWQFPVVCIAILLKKFRLLSVGSWNVFLQLVLLDGLGLPRHCQHGEVVGSRLEHKVSEIGKGCSTSGLPRDGDDFGVNGCNGVVALCVKQLRGHAVEACA